MTVPSRPTTRWDLIVPVKQTTLAKTRLTGYDRPTRRRLALSFALDTVAAALASSAVRAVTVVTNDDEAALFVDLGAAVVPDAPDAGLNPALVHAGQAIRAGRADADLAAISSDLPALTPEVLARALGSVHGVPGFVADAHGVGTTLVAVPHGHPWSPRFGPHSRAAHRAIGWHEVDDTGLARLRRDVDTPVDLWDARRLGIGAHTRATLASIEGDL